jgi:hypothetical protein
MILPSSHNSLTYAWLLHNLLYVLSVMMGDEHGSQIQRLRRDEIEGGDHLIFVTYKKAYGARDYEAG